MTRIAALIAATLLFASVQALPWTTVDALKADMTSAEPSACSGSVSAPGMMFKVEAAHDGVDYLVFLVPAEEGQTIEKIVAAQMDASGAPVYIYTGYIDETSKKLVTTESHPFNSDKDQGPCQVLFPASSN